MDVAASRGHLSCLESFKAKEITWQRPQCWEGGCALQCS